MYFFLNYNFAVFVCWYVKLIALQVFIDLWLGIVSQASSVTNELRALKNVHTCNNVFLYHISLYFLISWKLAEVEKQSGEESFENLSEKNDVIEPKDINIKFKGNFLKNVRIEYL